MKYMVSTSAVASALICYGFTATPVAAQQVAVPSVDGTEQEEVSPGFPEVIADDTDDRADNVIIVTAQKRGTSLQKTPIAVTSLSGESLQDSQISSLADLGGKVPSLKFGNAGGFGQVNIRGIGIQNFIPGAESAVAINLNQIYLSRPSSFLTGLYDVSALEVARGPQGTLYGRNATAGAVNITTRRPADVLEGNVALTIGNYDKFRMEAGVGGPIIDGTLKARVAGFVETRGGYGENFATGREANTYEAQGIRGTIVLGDGPLTATLIGEYYNEDSSHGQYLFGTAALSGRPGALGAPIPGIVYGPTNFTLNDYDVFNDMQNVFELETTTLTGLVQYETGDITLSSATGYRDQELRIVTDIDGTDANFATFYAGEPADQFSQELSVSYNRDQVNLIAGVYYFDETDPVEPSVVGFSTTIVDPILAQGGIVIPPRPAMIVPAAYLGGTIYTRSKAVYAEGSFELFENFTVIAGIRYSEDQKRLESRFKNDFFTPFDPTNILLPAVVAKQEETFDSVTPKFGFQYQATPATMVYATYSQGFKSGSFDVSTNPFPDGIGQPQGDVSYEPEELKSYEVGLKTTILDGKLRANLAGFYYDYSNLQVQQADTNFGISTSNAADATIKGIEAEITFAPVEGLELAFSGAYLDSKYGDYTGFDGGRPLGGNVDFSGNRLNNAPEFSGIASIEYSVPAGNGDLSLRGETEFSTEYFFSPGNYEVAGQEGYAKFNAFLTYRLADGLKLTAFAKNISNEVTRLNAQIQTIFLLSQVQGSLSPPRTYGLTVSYNY